MHSRIYLIGMPGVGKSTIGKKLAIALNYKFYDLDNLIVSSQSKSIEEIFTTKGENYFRAIETKILKETSNLKQAVIACGGGTPAFNNNINWLNKNGLTLYLKASLGFILNRITNAKQARPLLKSDVFESLEEKLQRLFLQREPYYKQATITFKISSENTQDIVNELIKLI